MFSVVFRIASSVVCYLNVSCNILIASVGEKGAGFSAAIKYWHCLVSVRKSSSYSGCLEKAALFYFGTPCAFHMTI